MSSTSTDSAHSTAASSKTQSATSPTATYFGTCKASTPSTCKASSTRKLSSTYFIVNPSSTASRSPSRSPSSSTASPTSALTNTSVSHSGLSTGAKVGVGVGVGVGVLAFLALLALLIFFMRKRRASQLERPIEQGDSGVALATESVADTTDEKQSAGGEIQELNS